MTVGRLNSAEVREIWVSTDTYRKIARKYGIKQTTISDIKCGKYYRSITDSYKDPPGISDAAKCGKKGKLNKEQVEEIWKSTESHKGLSKRYNVSTHIISEIKNRMIWNHITKDLGDPGLNPNIQPRSGSHAYRFKLSDEDIRDIFLSDMNREDLAEKHDITVSMVSQIKTGKAWKNITRPLANQNLTGTMI